MTTKNEEIEGAWWEAEADFHVSCYVENADEPKATAKLEELKADWDAAEDALDAAWEDADDAWEDALDAAWEDADDAWEDADAAAYKAAVAAYGAACAAWDGAREAYEAELKKQKENSNE